MKRTFAFVLAVVMVLAIASSAMAFSWGAGSGSTAESFANRYKIQVVKLANETGLIGTNKLIEAPGATAVNNASVYYYIRLTVSGSNVDDPDAIQENAYADVSFTALSVMNAGSLTTGRSDIPLVNKSNGVYYYNVSTGDFELITGSISNSVFSAAAIEARCLDTATAKVHTKVYSKRPFGASREFQAGGYYVLVNGDTVMFADTKGATAGDVPGTNCIKFIRNSSRQVTDVVIMQATSDGNWVDNLYTYLGFRAPDITGGRIYMTDDNLRAAFGFDYRGESSITWNANSTAIILDPTVTVGIPVGIPKTGDNAGVIGFALLMLAAIGAAVAVKKIKA